MRSFFTYSFFIIMPIAVGIGICAVLIYGGRSVYYLVENKIKPSEYIAKVVQVQNIATSTDANGGVKAVIVHDNFKQITAQGGKVDLPITSSAYLVGNLENGQVVIEKNKSVAYPIASVTKLMTAVVAKELIDPNALIPISSNAYYTEGKTGHLVLGEKIKASDLFYPMLMVSSNDAAEAFAQYYGRGKFIKAMNAKVASWGAKHTRFYDASGLNPSNVSTPDDLLKIISALYKEDPDIIAITHTKTKSIKGHSWVNATHFLNLSSYIGGKNGYTEEADRTAVSLFSLVGKDGLTHPLAIIILQSDSRDKDVLAIIKYLENKF